MTVTRRSSGVSLLLVLVLVGASCEETRREVEGEDQRADLGGLSSIRSTSSGPPRSEETDSSVKGSQGTTSAEDSRTGGSSEETHPEKDLAESRKKKDSMQQIYMLFMMWQSFVSTKMMMLDPIFKVKSFFISAIGLIVKILDLLLKYKSSKAQESGGGGWSVGAATGWEDRLGAPISLAPNYITRYTLQQ